MAKSQATSSFDARTASRRAVQTLMPLLGARQEVAKKRAQAFPLGTPGIAALQRKRREVTYTLPVLCLNFSQHERQAGKARAFAFRFAKN